MVSSSQPDLSPPSSLSSATMKAESSKENSPRPTSIAPKSKPKKRLNFCGTQTFVTFIVGHEDQKFVVHKSLVEHYSPAFVNAFNGNFIEGQTGEMTLRDVDADIFGLVVNWLYTQEIIPPVEEKEIRLVELAQLWSLAGRFLIPKLQNQAIKQMDLADSQTSMGDLIMEWKDYVSVGLDKDLEGTLLYRKAMDDVLDLFNMVMDKTPGQLDLFVAGIFGDGDGPAARFIESMIVHCGPFLAQNCTRKPAREYFVKVDTATEERTMGMELMG